MPDLSSREKLVLLDNIARLGGKSNKAEDIIYEGEKIVIPEKMSLKSAHAFIGKRLEEEEEPASFSRVYPFRPWDGGYNAYQAFKKAFGMVTGVAQEGFFGKTPPQYIKVAIGPKETVEIPWGQFQVPLLENTTIEFGQQHHPEWGLVFQLFVTSPRKNRFVIDGLFQLVEEELAANSIYRGKAFDGQSMPEFLNLDGVDPARVVYSRKVRTELEAHIWGVMRYASGQEALDLPLKRAILLAGTYGVGKTLAAYLTAQEAVRNGWAFIMAKPGRDDIYTTLQTGRLYQPCVVFLEDAETVASAEEGVTSVSQVLDLFDGMQSKGTKMMVIMTTNHPEKVMSGMRRSGRIDALIEIGPLDAEGMETLIRVSVGENRLANKVKWTEVTNAMHGYLPAFVSEVAIRAKRYALIRNEGNPEGILITTEDLVNAAEGLRSQFDWMQETPDKAPMDSVGAALARTTKEAIAAIAAAEEDANPSVWNRERIGDLQNANGSQN